MAADGGGRAAAVLGAGAAAWPYTPGVLVYAVLVITGSWVYPLLTVYLPHHGYGDTPLTRTRTLRGRVIPAVFLELTYHLEHHLYPLRCRVIICRSWRAARNVLRGQRRPAGARC